ncbi:MAG: GNAT family N-acetyltransferase [Clostridia bacterium]|nr:GNAT family N-acetyltransferase [Clostridia bacterium]
MDACISQNACADRSEPAIELVDAPRLAQLLFDDGLSNFRPAARQKARLLELRASSPGAMAVARKDETAVGYFILCTPDKEEYWGAYEGHNLLEASLEVSPRWRGRGLAMALARRLAEEDWEDYILIASCCYWNWDLRRTGLNAYAYRRVLQKIFSLLGLIPYPTVEPDVRSHPANIFLLRLGSRVTAPAREAFLALCLGKAPCLNHPPD